MPLMGYREYEMRRLETGIKEQMQDYDVMHSSYDSVIEHDMLEHNLEPKQIKINNINDLINNERNRK